MNPLKTAAIALCTYSVLPIPRFRWSEEDMLYALCALPLVGVMLGGAYYLWTLLASALSLSPALFAAVSVCFPVAVTGGIHLDGFCDVSDALASHQPRERKLEILKDSHIGAFAAIKCAALMLLSFGLYCELYTKHALTLALCFVLSRALSALLAALLPKARREGMLVTYAGQEKNLPTAVFSAALCALCAAALVLSYPLGGCIAIILCAAWCLLYKRLAIKNFGGVTGDTAGYFLQITELLLLLSITLGSITERVLPC